MAIRRIGNFKNMGCLIGWGRFVLRGAGRLLITINAAPRASCGRPAGPSVAAHFGCCALLPQTAPLWSGRRLGRYEVAPIFFDGPGLWFALKRQGSSERCSVCPQAIRLTDFCFGQCGLSWKIVRLISRKRLSECSGHFRFEARA